MSKGDIPMIKFIGTKLNNKTILDLGCGDCSFIAAFPIDKSKYIGLDINNAKISLAQIKGYNVKKIDLNKTDRLLFKNKLDIIILKDILEHLNNPLKKIQETYRLLKCEGSIFISVPSEWSQLIWDDYTHQRGFTRRAITELLNNAGFHIVQFRKYQDLIRFRTNTRYYLFRLLFKKLIGIDLITQGYLIEAKKN